MKTLLICHGDDPLTREIMARWLASFSELAGIVLVEEPRSRRRKRARRELERLGRWRYLDVLAWRLYHCLVLGARDRFFEAAELERIRKQVAPVPDNTPALRTRSPNSVAARAFIRRQRPDLIVTRCRTPLRPEVFRIPDHGSWVMQRGSLPVHGDDGAGMTLLKMEEGSDAVYGHYFCHVDHMHDTPAMLDHRAVIENLPALKERLLDYVAGNTEPVGTERWERVDRGQPWLSRYLRWKWRARMGRELNLVRIWQYLVRNDRNLTGKAGGKTKLRVMGDE